MKKDTFFHYSYSKNLLQQISKYKEIIVYGGLKYFEFLTNAYLFLSLAKLVTPAEYGMASPAFLLITYCSFVVLGVNQVVVKWYSKELSGSFRFFLLKYCFYYNLIFSLLLFAGVFYYYESPFGWAIAVITAAKLMTEAIGTVFRVVHKIVYINIISVSTSLCFLFFYFKYVTGTSSFFDAWAASCIVGLCVAFIVYFWNFRNSVAIRLREYNYLLRYRKIFFIDGIRFTTISIVSTLFISLDRLFFIRVYHLPSNLLGNVQLADNIASTISLGVGSILFILTSKILESLNTGKLTPDAFIRNGYTVFALILALVILMILPIRWAVGVIFPEYESITYPMCIYMLIKILNLALFVPNILCITFSKEVSYIKVSLVWLLVIIIILFLLPMVFNFSALFYATPLIILAGLTGMHLSFFFMGNDNNERRVLAVNTVL